MVGRRLRGARDVHAAAVGSECRVAPEGPRAARDAVRVLAGGVDGPEMCGRPVRARGPGVVADLEPIVMCLDARGVGRVVACDVGEAAPVRSPSVGLDAVLRAGDPRGLAAVHPEHVELGRRFVLVVGILRRRGDERNPVARGDQAGLWTSSRSRTRVRVAPLRASTSTSSFRYLFFTKSGRRTTSATRLPSGAICGSLSATSARRSPS